MEQANNFVNGLVQDIQKDSISSQVPDGAKAEFITLQNGALLRIEKLHKGWQDSIKAGKAEPFPQREILQEAMKYKVGKSKWDEKYSVYSQLP
jgi:hypothetical protein